MKHKLWLKSFLCVLMLIVAVVVMAGCNDSKKQEEAKTTPKKVTFVVDGVEYEQLQTGDPMPEPPVKDGYTFEGWYKGSEKVTQIPENADNDLTLEAKWSLTPYRITFENTKGAENTNEVGFTIESEAIVLQSLQKEGYIFGGWYAGGLKIERIEKGTHTDLTLTAKWTPIPYDLRFDNVTGATNPNPDSFTVEDGKIVLKTPTRDGYTFNGWYLDGNLVTELDASAATGYLIRAEWRPVTYDIVFENTKDAANDNVLNFTIESDDIVLSALTKEGYRFIGWYSDNACVDRIPKGTFGNVTLRAEWKAIRYNIVFENIKGAENPNDAYFTIEDDVITLKPLTKEGYVFNGWYINNLPVTEIATNVLDDVTIVAKWTALTYDISYENTDGATHENPTQYTPDDAITLLPLEKTGYRFLGWFVGNTEYTTIAQGTVGNLTLTAKWEKIAYTITYENVKDAVNDNIGTYDVESDTITLKPLNLAGYRFLGWYAGGIKIEKILNGTTGDLVLEAKWALETYTVTLENTKGATDTTELTYDLFHALTLPTLTTKGYTFNGWYDADGTQVTAISEGSSGNMTLTARWTVTVYTITYENLGDNTHNNPTSYTIEDTITLEALPNGEDTFFSGWYLDDLRVESIPAGTTGDLVLKADWRIPVYTVEDLKGMTLAGDYLLMNDLDLGGVEWVPIGTESAPFEGSFNGGGHTISDYQITDGSLTCIGLFGKVIGSISDLTVKDFTISTVSGSMVIYAGGIVGRMENGSLVNCSATGTLQGFAPKYSSNSLYIYVGGLAGCFINGSRVVGCNSDCDIHIAKATHIYAGGLIGSSNLDSVCTVSDCEADVNIAADTYSQSYAGGIVGNNTGSVQMENCNTTGIIDLANSNGSGAWAGGLLGSQGDAKITIEACTSKVNIDAWSNRTYVGGIIGCGGNADSCLNDVSYEGEIRVANEKQPNYYFTCVGGVAGAFAGQVVNCSAKATLSLDRSNGSIGTTGTYVGGLVGKLSGDIRNSHADVKIAIDSGYIAAVGGLAGEADKIENCYAIVDVSVTNGLAVRENAVGGLAGNADVVTDSYATVNIMVANVVNHVGGLVGTLGNKYYPNGKMTNSYATGTIKGMNSVGGLVGTAYNAVIHSCWGREIVVEAMYSNGNTYDRTYAGGLVGCGIGDTKIDHCYASATVTVPQSNGYVYAGGIVGSGSVANSYAIGSVDATGKETYAGGISGNGDVSDCFASVSITALATTSNAVHIGAVCGSSYNCENNYYDRDAVYKYGLTSDTEPTVGLTVSEGAVAIDPQNIKSRDWVAENLWTFETDYWLFNGSDYPTFNDEWIANTVIEIGTVDQLAALSGKTLFLNYKLTADIDLNSAEWTPILAVYGIFDGNGYTISDFKMTSSDYKTYGFIVMNTGTVRNLLLKQVQMNGQTSATTVCIGALIGYNAGSVENCGVSGGSISFFSTGNYNSDYSFSIGGLVGMNDGTINGCYSAINVSASKNKIETRAGGLVGYNSNGTILNSYAMGNVNVYMDSSLKQGTAFTRVGGLVGEHRYGEIAYCYSTGTVYGSGPNVSAGGLIGTCAFGELNGQQLFAACSKITAYSSYYTRVGALTNSAPSNLADCYSLSGIQLVQSKYNYGDDGEKLTKKEILAVVAENWDSTVWKISETDYPTLQYFTK